MISAPTGHFLDELRATFANRAAEVALIFPDASYTFGDFEQKAERCAAWLGGLGVGRGDRVVLATAAKRPFLAAHLGAIFAGAVALPVNPKFTRDEMRHVLADSGARVAVVGREARPVVEALRDELPELRAVVADADAWDAPDARFAAPGVPADDPCLILYSSGTTGRPKGVVHTQANLANSLRALQARWRFTPADVLVNVLPLFHIHGLSFAAHLSLLTGGRMIIEESFHPRRTLDVIGRGTVFMAIPTFYYALLDRPEFRDAAAGWGHVRLFTCGSAPIRPEVLPGLESVLGRPVINRYGMTEGHVITSLPLDGPWPQGSVGLPLDGVEVRVAHDDGTPAPTGEVGTVLLRGPNLFREYWRNPEATRTAFASGWFDTGDLGRRDDAGFLTLVGRKNDLIITSGFNVYPPVVERVINDCPGVKESAVLGLPDDRRGERVTAVIVRADPALDERRVKAHCAEHLVDYQRPTTVGYCWRIHLGPRRPGSPPSLGALIFPILRLVDPPREFANSIRSFSSTSCRATRWERCSGGSSVTGSRWACRIGPPEGGSSGRCRRSSLVPLAHYPGGRPPWTWPGSRSRRWRSRSSSVAPRRSIRGWSRSSSPG